ncbi:putative serine/arginine-rich splicing factor 1B-like isoform X3 [Apostichopus japonicus]|uniref:Putative serine/arginine-rich splicing factor 1B-like isoform X3 n=2 Tax=Stichopus japonicus TaxID=307972 RepID=A0A2G8K089_STIJA|nr:putative serine/arginine-rich splicing factor 1B-like isoform X3 [Apostichopus japonicus]
MSGYHRSRERGGGDEDRQKRVYVGNLPPDIREKDLTDLFYSYGNISHIELKRNQHSAGTPFAFVEFENKRDAEDAKFGRNGFDYDGYNLRVESPKGSARGGYHDRGGGGRSSFGGGEGRGGGGGGGGGRPKGPPPRRSDYRCLVTGLPPTGSWQDLKDHMREAGDVCYTDVYNDGTGVVEFVRMQDMEYAIRNLDHSQFKSHQGEVRRIVVREDRVSQERSRSRSFSPRRRRGGYSPPPYKRSRSHSRNRNRSDSRSSSRD